MAAPDLYEVGRGGNGRMAHNDTSIGELFSELTSEARTLVRQEIELAKAEMTEKATRVGKDAGMITAGGIIAWMGAFVLLAAAVIGLGHLIGYGLSALIIGVIVTGAGLAIAMKGRNDLKQASLSPDRTKATMKETKLWLKEQI